MYCAACGGPVTPGLKFCNRCGSSLGKERVESSHAGIITALITGIVMVGLGGLGIMLAGALNLKTYGQLGNDVVAIFMFLTFLIVITVEMFLLRQLSRVLGESSRRNQRVDQPQPLFQPATASPNELRAAPLRTLPEPIPSVTENTTRTLEHSLRESSP
jgi:predicted nucleic acid-binding Zn ribbon protein